MVSEIPAVLFNSCENLYDITFVSAVTKKKKKKREEHLRLKTLYTLEFFFTFRNPRKTESAFFAV